MAIETRYQAKRKVSAFWLGLVSIFLLLSGCERMLQQMYNQPRYDPFDKSKLFPDDQSARPLVSNTVVYASGGFASPSSGRAGVAQAPIVSWELKLAQGSNPFPITLDFLRRGQERFNIYCAPCHSLVGDGNGMIAHRGFPAPPSYHSKRLRNAPDSHFYNVITEGHGLMFSYADRVKPEDRWAIAAYIRALQLSQYASLDSITKLTRQSLEDNNE
jgi:mono/diheme cytochrome c family protein